MRNPLLTSRGVKSRATIIPPTSANLDQSPQLLAPAGRELSPDRSPESKQGDQDQGPGEYKGGEVKIVLLQKMKSTHKRYTSLR